MHEDYLFSGFRSLDEKRAGGGVSQGNRNEEESVLTENNSDI